MNEDLTGNYFNMLLRFKRMIHEFQKIGSITLTELLAMAGISKKSFLAGNSVSIAEVQKQTQTTKSAVSTMFTTLEKKGYVIRETDRTNRRNITVELTPEGERVLDEMDKKFTATLGKVLTQFGDENTVRLITLMNAFMDVLATVKEDILL